MCAQIYRLDNNKLNEREKKEEIKGEKNNKIKVNSKEKMRKKNLN